MWKIQRQKTVRLVDNKNEMIMKKNRTKSNVNKKLYGEIS